MKRAKKHLILALALLLTAAAHAQVFIVTEEEIKNSERTNPQAPMVPAQGGDGDQTQSTTPLGSGWLLLAALGGAYLVGKRRKQAV